MSHSIPMVGRRFNRLLVIEQNGVDGGGKRRWLCRCDCGNETTVEGYALRTSDIKSCGCLKLEQAVATNTIHGRSKDSRGAWVSWRGMLQRCQDKNSPKWARYGGRGIAVCERWLEFRNFLADMGEMPEGKSIDRIDNDGNYEPSNCRWATRKEQARNTSRNRLVTINGLTKCVAEWRELGAI